MRLIGVTAASIDAVPVSNHSPKGPPESQSKSVGLASMGYFCDLEVRAHLLKSGTSEANASRTTISTLPSGAHGAGSWDRGPAGCALVTYGLKIVRRP
jgi:hypothetical protein